MSGFAALLRKELLEQWRTLRLPVVAAVFLLVGLISPLLARFTPEILKAVGGDQFQIILPTPTTADAVDQLCEEPRPVRGVRRGPPGDGLRGDREGARDGRVHPDQARPAAARS